VSMLASPGSRPMRAAAGIGFVAAILCVLAWWLDAPRLLSSWLVAWLFFLGIALGALVNVMIHELTGGTWGFAIRPPLEAAIGTLPALAAMSLPLAFGLSALFPWAHPGAAGDAVAEARRWYLNTPAFALRAIVYFALWIALGTALRRHWGRRDTNATQPQPALRALSAAGILVYAVTMTLAAVDWIMSLSADWHSSVFGLLVMVGQALSAFAFAVAFAAFAGRARRTSAALDDKPAITGDLGNILLMFVMTWAYLAFTQFLIIWAADLPSEIDWYVLRAEPRWRWLAITILVVQFALPFGAMLFRSFKRDPRRLGGLCVVVLVAHWLEILWLVAPGFRSGRAWLQWTDALAFIAVGGLWTGAFLASFIDKPAVAAPRHPEVAGHG
jgi:hypothetical protein